MKDPLFARNTTMGRDNCSIHKGNALQMSISNTEHELIFLPPYSPQLNPIEEMFSKWKCLIKKCNSNTLKDYLHQ